MIRDLCFDRSGDVHGFGNGRAVVGMHGGSNRKKENTFNGGDASRNFRFDDRSYAHFWHVPHRPSTRRNWVILVSRYR